MSTKLTELINTYYNAVSGNVAEARVALDTEINRIVAELEFCESALQLILDIAEGSATVNSFPHIAKIARKALDEGQAMTNPDFNDANIVAVLKMPGNSTISFQAGDLIEAQAAQLAAAKAEIARLNAEVVDNQECEMDLRGKLAAANARIAEAEKVIAGLDAAFTNELDLSKRSPMFVRAVKAARAWMEGKSDE